MKVTINAIVAMDDNNGIGFENGLPWPHNKKDMAWFKKYTSDDVVVMGRKTWESIGSKKLPNRDNIVITSKLLDELGGEPDAVVQGPSIIEILQGIIHNHPGKTIWIIGGKDIYEQAIQFCHNLYITRVKGEYECDTYLDKELFNQHTNLAYVEDHDDLQFEIWSRA